MTTLKLIHLLSALIWVGGMFFAYVVLRPAAVEVLDPPQRLSLWDTVFRRFFVWVWGAIGVLLFSGFYMIFLYGRFSGAPRHVDVMLVLGLSMIVIYFYVYFACYRTFSKHVAGQNWKEAGNLLARIRKLIAFNLTLGILTICIAVIGVSWSWSGMQ
jgi:uncharacterized membrane protein